MFYANDSCSVGQELPLATTGLLDMFTIVLAGRSKPLASQLKRSLGARKHMVRDLVEYMQDKEGSLVDGFSLARQASVSKANLDTHPSDGSVLQELLDAVLYPQDPRTLCARASSSYANDRRESDAIDEDGDSDGEESSATVVRRKTHKKTAGLISSIRTRS